MTGHEEIQRGREAASELKRVDEAFVTVRERMFAAWMNTKPSEADVRERIYAMLHNIAAARAVLIEAVNAGSLAEGNAAVEEALRPGL